MPENYREQVDRDAKDTIVNFIDEIVNQIIEKGEASDDLNNDYPDGDSYHHENHVDQDYSLLEAAELLDQLSEHEETDSGLWEGLEPRRAVTVQAAFTYGNAVYAEWRRLIEEINDDVGDAVDALRIERENRKAMLENLQELDEELLRGLPEGDPRRVSLETKIEQRASQIGALEDDDDPTFVKRVERLVREAAGLEPKRGRRSRKDWTPPP